MVPILSLWLPIFVSAIVVFLVSFIIHTALKYHASDFIKLPDEAGVTEALRKFNIPPGDYLIPRATSMKEMQSPEHLEKVKKGPNAVITIWAGGPPSMSKELTLWFVYSIVVGIFAAYIAGRALGVGAAYLSVFRFVGATAFLGYSLALCQQSIWYKKQWTATLKSMFDGLIYALFTAGVFGWLWPR